MKFEVIELKNHFQFLGDDGRNPTLKAYLPDNLTEMGRDHQKRPCAQAVAMKSAASGSLSLSH